MTQRLIEPTTVQAGPRSSVRDLVARHPVAAFLGICYAVTWATAVPLRRHNWHGEWNYTVLPAAA